MRYREVKKGMEVTIYRPITFSGECYLGKVGIVDFIIGPENHYNVTVKFSVASGDWDTFNHKELKEIK